jgi:tetratricopeptide (TPR) repeat protein
MALELGDLQMRFGKYELALETYTRARSYIVGHGDLTQVATAEGRIADSLLRLDCNDEAITHAREDLNMSKTCPCPRCVPDAHLRLGKCLVKAGQVESGLEYIEKARGAFHAINEPGMQGHCLFAKATALKESDPLQARELLGQARSIYTGLDWSWPLDKVLVSIADLDLAEGNSADAITAYEQVLIRAKELSRHGLQKEVELRLSKIKTPF